jgi:hypothetical protein
MTSTGPIESWNVNPTEVGPLYPFAGWEVLMFAVCVAFSVLFMVWKFRTESADYDAKVKQLGEPGELAKALAATQVTDDHRLE